MKSSSKLQITHLAVFALVVFLVPRANAQNAVNVRVVRLSLADGQVLVSHPGSNLWEEATVNLPLQEGDSIATQDGRAEMEFENGATAYLAENSVLQFTQLGFSPAGRLTELTLTQGAGTFYANLTRQDSFRVKTLTFDIAVPERAEFRVDGFQDGAAVQVFQGDIAVSTTKGSTTLEKGQSVAVHEKDFDQKFSVGSLPAAEDAFDQWVTQEGELIRSGNQNTLSYVSSPNVYGLSDLSRYGSWVDIPNYGRSWHPFSAGFGWTPYFNGKWILDSRLGWTWVSSEPWGWMPYHFGSWLLSPTLGWVWIPGGSHGLSQWQGARVNWVSDGSHAGWVPMSPNDRPGAPANVAQGIITQSERSSVKGATVSEIIYGKNLRTVTPLAQPPAGFASRPEPGAPNVAARSAIRMAPQRPPLTPDKNPSIVYDREARTYVNREAGSTANAPQPYRGVAPPVPPAALMPAPTSGARPNIGRSATGQTEPPRVTMPPHSPIDPRTNRVLLPPSYSAMPVQRGPGALNAPPMTPPVSTLPRTNPPRVVMPGPIVSPSGVLGAIPNQGMPGGPHVPNSSAPMTARPMSAPPAAPAASPAIAQRPAPAATTPTHPAETQTPHAQPDHR